jgi:hypothetical protein
MRDMREIEEKRPRERHCGDKGEKTGRDTEGETEKEGVLL